ncbi:MAG: hypothetical protein KIT84_14665 [Labilithrix sp.]|nr:hypothetical protein [Labilithrix sp.]MCW5812264.1 hypothetical protein [Labilithrix sp.]
MRLFASLLLALLLVSARAFAADATDAGAGESTYGCVEHVPKGAEKMTVTDTFPARGISGYAATLSITVRHGKGERVLPSGLDLSGAVEAKKVLKQAGFVVPEQDAGAGARLWSDAEDTASGTAVTHLELPLVLLPEKPGRNVMAVPPLPVAVSRANGEIATLCTHPHTILVEDPTANTPDAMPRENPPGVPQREEWTAMKKAVLWGALGLAAGAIIALLVRRWLNRPRPVPPPPPPRPPWEVALEELEAVRHAGLLEAERYGEHFDRTSDALRRYLGARFDFDGLESTTDEILAALKKNAGGFIRFEDPEPGAVAFAPGMSIERIATFLRDADLVKFANLTPTPEQCARSITSGEAIVRGTMPFSQGGTPATDFAVDDPVAAAGLRSPDTEAAPPAPPKEERSPYAPPDDYVPPKEGDS